MLTSYYMINYDISVLEGTVTKLIKLALHQLLSKRKYILSYRNVGNLLSTCRFIQR